MGPGRTEADKHPQKAEDRIGRRERTEDSETERPKYASEESLICNSHYEQYICKTLKRYKILYKSNLGGTQAQIQTRIVTSA